MLINNEQNSNILNYVFVSNNDIQIIKKLIENSKRSYSRDLQSNKYNILYPGLWNRIQQEFSTLIGVDENTTIPTKLYMLANGMKELPKCPVCGKYIKNIQRISLGFPSHCSIKCSTNSEIKKQKSKQTKQNRYNDPNYNNRPKAIETCQREYNCINVFQVEKYKEKCVQSYLKNWGVENPSQSEIIKKKKEKTCLKNNDVKYPMQSIKFQDRAKRTKEKLYNDLNYNNRPKAIETCQRDFGKDWYFQTDQFKEKYKDKCNKKFNSDTYLGSQVYKDLYKDKEWVRSKEWKKIQTLKENGSLGPTSKLEEQYLDVFKFLFGADDIISQYTDIRYSSEDGIVWKCDIYVKSIDLFVEIQGSQYHHGHPFDPNNPKDIKELEKLKERAKSCPKNNRGKNQYDNIIYTWTQLDVKKRNSVKRNNLNYLEIWS